jgi:hypothetical protein
MKFSNRDNLNNHKKLEIENKSGENQPENEETQSEGSNNEHQLEDQQKLKTFKKITTKEET